MIIESKAPTRVDFAGGTLDIWPLYLFHPQGGFTLTTDSEAPAGAGIGGSSAMAVAICAALDRFTGAGKSKVDWIHISRDAEAIVINVPTGTQDHYPPAFGGAAAIELPPGRSE